jgi:hypothetical protein
MADRQSRAGGSIPALALLGVLGVLGGCSQSASIGSTCTLSTPGTAVDEVTVSTPALECEGRICLQVGSASPLCTGSCASDDDCRNLAPAAGNQCPRGFECRAVSPFGAQPCQRLCVCKDAPPVAAGCQGTP